MVIPEETPTPVPSLLEPAYGVGSQHEEPRFHDFQLMQNFRSEPAFNDFSDLDVPGSGRSWKRPGHNAAPPRAPIAAPPRAPIAAPPRAPNDLWKSLTTAATKVVKLISKAGVYLLKSDGGVSFIEEFHKLLGSLSIMPIALVGLHFQGLAISPLHTHSNIILPFIAAAIVHHITYMVIKLQDKDAGPILRFTCIVSGNISIELLHAMFLSLSQLIKVHLYAISLTLGAYCLFYTADVLRKKLGTLGGNQTQPGTPHRAQPQQLYENTAN